MNNPEKHTPHPEMEFLHMRNLFIDLLEFADGQTGEVTVHISGSGFTGSLLDLAASHIRDHRQSTGTFLGGFVLEGRKSIYERGADVRINYTMMPDAGDGLPDIVSFRVDVSGKLMNPTAAGKQDENLMQTALRRASGLTVYINPQTAELDVRIAGETEDGVNAQAYFDSLLGRLSPEENERLAYGVLSVIEYHILESTEKRQ